MAKGDRERKLTQAQGVAALRSMHLRGLSEAGGARAAALAEADTQLDRIARLLHDALDGGVSMAEVARVTGVSRQTLYELRARYGDSRDVRLAVLQSLLQPDATVEAISVRVGRPVSEVQPIIDEFVEKGLAHEDPGHEGWEYGMSTRGLKALQEWALADDPMAEPLWEVEGL